MDHVVGTLRDAANVMVPSAGELLMAGPRLVQKAIAHLPEPFTSFFDMLRLPGTVIADATSTAVSNSTVSPTITSFTQSATAVGSSPLASVTPEMAEGFLATLSQNFGLHKLSNLDGVFSYLFSRWALSTFGIVRILFL